MSNGEGVQFVDRVAWEGPTPRPFLVIGYYTVDTPYETEKETLRLSLEELGYSYDLRGVEHQGSWQKNTQLKAQVIRAMLEEHNQPLLYLDVDSIVTQRLYELEEIDADIAAVHFYQGGKLSGELLSGTVYFSGSEACLEVVEEWCRLNKAHPDKLPDKRIAWDQRTLRLAIHAVDCRFFELPQAYTWIVQLTQRHSPGLQPIIMHIRGAWRFKKQINNRPVA